MESIVYLAIVAFFAIRFVHKINEKNAGNKRYSDSPRSGKGGTLTDAEIKKAAVNKEKQEASAMPHVHKEEGVHETYNRHKKDNTDGAMPHEHEKVKIKHYDVASLPPGYILLNGEPVRTKDLENR